MKKLALLLLIITGIISSLAIAQPSEGPAYALSLVSTPEGKKVMIAFNLSKEITLSDVLQLEEEAVKIELESGLSGYKANATCLLFFNPAFLMGLPLLSTLESISSTLTIFDNESGKGSFLLSAPRLIILRTSYSFSRGLLYVNVHVKIWYNPLTGVNKKKVESAVRELPLYIKLVNMTLCRLLKGTLLLRSFKIKEDLRGPQAGMIGLNMTLSYSPTGLCERLKFLNIRRVGLKIVIDLFSGVASISLSTRAKVSHAGQLTYPLRPPLP